MAPRAPRAAAPVTGSPHTVGLVIVHSSMTMKMNHSRLTTCTYASPLGPLTLIAGKQGLRAVIWPGEPHARVGLAGVELMEKDDPMLAQASVQLEEYFNGSRQSFDLQLDLHGTRFQVAAWRALAEIPYGETRTYAEQAERLGRPRAFRAVGAANGRNPLSIVLPCHRVVGSNGSLTGFAAGLDVKRALLDHEQVVRARL